MRKGVYLGVVILLFLLFSVSSIAVDVDSCSSITSTGNLTQSVSAIGGCMTFGPTSHGVVFDCNGFTITWDTNGFGNNKAIDMGGIENVTVKNCILIDGTAAGSDSYGIYMGLGANSGYNITNNTIRTNGTTSNIGIQIYQGSHHRVTNNRIHTNGTTL